MRSGPAPARRRRRVTAAPGLAAHVEMGVPALDGRSPRRVPRRSARLLADELARWMEAV